MAARPRKNNVSVPNLYPLYSRKVNKVYWRYKHPVTGKFHSLGTNEAEAIAIATEAKEGANKRGNSSRLTQSFHFFMFEPIFSPVNALNQPI